MRYIIPSSKDDQEFIKGFNNDAYRLYKPITAIAIADINATDSLTISVKKGCQLLVMDISLCGWCYVQIGEKYGFSPCRFLQFQQEIQGIPSEYIKQFSAYKDDVNKQWKFYSITPGSFDMTTGAGDDNFNPSSKEEKKYSEKHSSVTCKHCGTKTTPLWRTGPSGSKSLCNACGLKWLRKRKGLERKKDSDSEDDLDKGITTTVHGFFSNVPKVEASSLEDSLKSATIDNGKKEAKKFPLERLQASDDKDEDNKASTPVNKLSLSYICHKSHNN
jgi:hypothetical protein